MKRLFALLVMTFILLAGCGDVSMNEKIINTIDNKSAKSESYIIYMKDISDFKWDKLVIYTVGSSNDEVSKALGTEFKDSTDLMGGMVFVYHNKIVHKENVPYDPERPNKLDYSLENKNRRVNCKLFTPKTAVFKGYREQIDGVYYYKISG